MVAALAPRFAQSPAEAAVTPLPKLFTHVAKSVAPLSQAIWAFPSRSRILCTDPVHYGPSLTLLQPRLVHQFSVTQQLPPLGAWTPRETLRQGCRKTNNWNC